MLRKFLLLFVAAALSAVAALADDYPCPVDFDSSYIDFDIDIDIKCVEYAREEAEKGDLDARFFLGWVYAKGNGVDKDKYQALRWFLVSGLSNAIRGENSGVLGDSRDVARLLSVMAEQGEAEAQFHLGLAYNSGYGVEKDKREAVYWYRAAAEQGVAGAQKWLGLMYGGGEGVIQDDREAYIWYLIGKAGGDGVAEMMVLAKEQEMSFEEIKSAKREAAKRLVEIEKRRIRNSTK